MTKRAGFSAGLPTIALLALTVVSACNQETPTGPWGGAPDGARAASTGVTVTAADPAGAPQDTTLDVRVLGTGFDKGSKVEFALDGVVDPRVRTNRTTYRTTKELVANITIAADAVPDRYDIIVTISSGKKGIGTERFAVEIEFEQIETPGKPASVSGLSPNGTFAMTVLSTCQRGAAPAVWQEASGLTLLPWAPGTCGGRARAVNDAGVAVGSNYFDAGSGLGVRWLPGAAGYVAQVLPSLPDGMEGGPVSINANGVIGAGNAAAVWTEGNTAWRMLAVPSGTTFCQGTYVNDAGQVAASCLTGGLYRTVFWSSAEALPTLLPLPAGATQSWPFAINGSGVIAGYANGSVNRPTVWRPAGAGWTAEVLTDIGNGGKAQALNAAGYVVGYVLKTNGDGIPVVWDPAGRLTQMQTVRSGVAMGISAGSSGLVIGGYVKTGLSISDQIAVRWRP